MRARFIFINYFSAFYGNLYYAIQFVLEQRIGFINSVKRISMRDQRLCVELSCGNEL